MPGHIRNRGKRADGTTRWQARWTHPNNSTIRKDKTFRDKDVARRWIVRMDAEAYGAMFSTPTNPERSRLFREIVAVWKETCWTGLQPLTRARYEETLRHYLLPEFGNTPVREITRERVRLYFARLIAARKPGKDGKPTDKPRLSPGSIRKIHTAFSAAMREALDMGLVPSNPCARVRGLPPVKPKGQIALTPDELRMVADEMGRVCAKRRGRRFADHPGYKLPVLLTGYTGLRAGELWALRRKDVDLLRGKLHIRRAVKDPEATDPNVRFGPPRTASLAPSACRSSCAPCSRSTWNDPRPAAMAPRRCCSYRCRQASSSTTKTSAIATGRQQSKCCQQSHAHGSTTCGIRQRLSTPASPT
jgi:hypothetical protein